MKTIKIIISLLAVMFVVSFVLISSAPVYANTEIKFIPSTTIPGSEFVASSKGVMIDSGSLGRYIIAIYNYGIGLVAVLAVVMVMFGGYKWIFAAGNASRISEAKSTIISALVGLFLALGSVMLLNTINPELTSFKPLYVPKPEIALCPWHVNSCDAVNSFFYYVKIENESSSATALKDSIDYYSKKFDLKPVSGDYSEERQSIIKSKICQNEEMTLSSCSIPSGVCVYDKDNNQSPCLSIAQIACAGVDAKCSSYPGSSEAFCQTLDQYCSLGVRGSKCKPGSNDCRNETGLTCLNNRCFRLGKEGESCENNNECEAGLVCSDDDDDIISPDKCVPGAVPCTTVATCFAADYKDDTSIMPPSIGAFCRLVAPSYSSPTYSATGWCDCDEDDDCDVGYRCVDVKIDSVDRDVCLPSSYR